MATKKRMPTDQNKRAKSILDIVTGQQDSNKNTTHEKNPAAVALGRLGGLKGGKARAKSLTKTQRSDIAKKAAAKRWKNK